jgi:Ca2+/Na+ antiporter
MTLPDKAISLIGGLHGHVGVVTSNATGSNIFLLTLVLSLAALLSGAGLAVAPTVAYMEHDRTSRGCTVSRPHERRSPTPS